MPRLPRPPSVALDRVVDVIDEDLLLISRQQRREVMREPEPVGRHAVPILYRQEVPRHEVIEKSPELVIGRAVVFAEPVGAELE